MSLDPITMLDIAKGRIARRDRDLCRARLIVYCLASALGLACGVILGWLLFFR